MKAREHAVPARTLRALRSRLLDWYDENKRDLPWRRTRDPYAIWVSETMLQQTRVETVIPYWERFVARFPDPAALAEADVEDVYASWTGLGYYSRARNLHAAARRIVDHHGGELPNDASALRELSGVGRYTAGAVASIAFDREEPLVDGNVMRVLARRFAWHEDVGDRGVVERFWSLAADLVRGPRPGDLNQALMELGATICTPRAPRCQPCPLRRSCRARREGDPEALPVKTKRTRVRSISAVAAWMTRRNRALAVQRHEGGLLGGMWELPGGPVGQDETPGQALVRTIGERTGLRVSGAEPAGEIEHLFTHRRLRVHVFRCNDVEGRVRLDGFAAHRWLSAPSLAELPHGGPTRKALALLGVASDLPHRARLRGATSTPPR